MEKINRLIYEALLAPKLMRITASKAISASVLLFLALLDFKPFTYINSYLISAGRVMVSSFNLASIVLFAIAYIAMPYLLFRRKKKEEETEKEVRKEEREEEEEKEREKEKKGFLGFSRRKEEPQGQQAKKKPAEAEEEPVIKIIKEDERSVVEEVISTGKGSQEETAKSEEEEEPAQTTIPYHMINKETNDPVDWILDCIGGYRFWPEDKGPLPKSELEKEFKKKFPNITIANFNSMVYDLIYKEKVTSQLSGGETLLQLSPEVKAEKAIEWNKRVADAILQQSQMQAQKPRQPAGERRKEWIEVKPQSELGKGGPWDELNRQMRDMQWYGRVMTQAPGEIKSLMWHRESPVHEHQPPKAYYPNIMLEWRQSVVGKSPYWHIEGVNITEEEFMKKIKDKTWAEWLAKNKIVIDVPTWEEAVVKVLELARSFVR